MIWQIISLSFKIRHKAVSQNAVPYPKSEEETLSKVWIFYKISSNDIGYVRFLFRPLMTLNVLLRYIVP